MAALNTYREPFTTALGASYTAFGTGVGGSSLTFTSNQGNFKLPASTAGSNYVGIFSPSGDLTGVAILCEFITPPANNANVNAYLAAYQTVAEQSGWNYQNGNLNGYKIVAGVTTYGFSIAYNSTNHRWLRLRESGGTIFYDTSADGETWTNQGSTAKPTHVTNCAVIIQAGTEASIASPGTAVFDNVNLPNVFLAAAGASSSTGTAAVAVTHTIAAAGASSSTGTADVVVTHTIAAAGASTSAGTAAVAVTHTLAANGDSVSAGTAAVVVTHTIAANGDSVSTGTAAVVVTHTLAAAGAAVSGGTASLTVISQFSFAVANGYVLARWQTTGGAMSRWQAAGSAERRWRVDGRVE